MKNVLIKKEIMKLNLALKIIISLFFGFAFSSIISYGAYHFRALKPSESIFLLVVFGSFMTFFNIFLFTRKVK